MTPETLLYSGLFASNLLTTSSRTGGNLSAVSNSPYSEAPDTGVIRSYEFTVTRGQIAPDGYEKSVILVNGQFPGPEIEANWGDMLKITVHNQITGPEEGTAFHWHGILHKETPWYDGVPGVTQCPIAPGKSFTYEFKADLYGTSWYHSHYSGQYAGGLLGPMLIHGPRNVEYDIDLGPVFIQDWYHAFYADIVDDLVKPNGTFAPKSQSNLINGRMNFNCALKAAGDNTPCTDNAGISKFQFTSGKTHLLRLINGGAEALQRFSIDGHEMTVIANDFVPVNPYKTKVVTLGIGQRTDVLVTANVNSTNAFWMRANISVPCSLAENPNALAAIYYDSADTNSVPSSVPWNVPDPGTCANDDLSLSIPTYPIPVTEPATTRTLEINAFVNATGSFLWTLDGVSFRANLNKPVLLQAEAGDLNFPAEWNVKNFGSNSTIRIIVNNRTPAAHPMHFHGHNMQILTEGPGEYNGSSVVRPNNPQRRDVQMVRPHGHFVFQYATDNPGIWPFHCHIAWHTSAGLYANLMERPEDIEARDSTPYIMQQTCTDWEAYTSSGNTVNQTDSGV